MAQERPAQEQIADWVEALGAGSAVATAANAAS
jgi:hypothetical protein